MNKKKAAFLLIAGIVLSALLAYFARPKPSVLELVLPRQELAGFSEHLPGSTALQDRVTKSYGLALVLVRTPYSLSNAVALESLRNWAAERFQQEPGFLHPIALEFNVPVQTVFDSLFYNLGAYCYYGMEDLVGNALKARIAHFHETKAYNSFRYSYFELFGVDSESATLLARYQAERAKLAIDVILEFALWVVALFAGCFYLMFGKQGSRFDRLRLVLSGWWLILAGSYLVIASTQNVVSMLISAVVAVAIGVYLRKPFMVSRQPAGELRLVPLMLPSRWVAIVLWTTYSLLVIQILTWIRLGSLNNSDPVTLILSAFSGNFLHDPSHGKLVIMRLAGIAWLILSAWTFWQSKRDSTTAKETRRALSSLEGPSMP